MTLLQTGLILLACTAPTLFASDPDLVKYVGTDAKEVAGIYVDRTVGSPLGSFVLSRLTQDSRDMQAFIAATGFDPRRDIREVFMASPGGQGQKTGLVVARGTFNTAQIATAAVEQGAIKESYKGIDVYWIANGRRRSSNNWFAFPESSIGLMGDEAMVKAAIDRKATASALDARLAEKIQTASSRYDAWFASLGQPGATFGSTKLPQDTLEVISGGLTLGQDVRLSAEAIMRTEKDAQSLFELIRFFTGLAQMQQQRNPDVARFMSLLQNAETKVQGTTVLFSTSAPEADIENLIRGPRRTANIAH